jgi:hypothetical protein
VTSEVCITIDDVPSICDDEAPQDEGRIPQAEYMGHIAGALRDCQVRPIFFLNSDRLRSDLWRPLELLDFAELGNHTASHCSVDNVSIEAWEEDVRRCNRSLYSLTGQMPRWFRYPYLRTGADAAKSKNARAVLKGLGLSAVPGSCAPLDWLFARYYVTALNVGDAELQKELERRAIENILLTVDDAIRQAIAVTSGSIPLVLVLHAGPLLGRILSQSLDRLTRAGARFIPWDAAMEAYEGLSAYDEYHGAAGPPYFLRLSERGRREIASQTDWLSLEARSIEAWWRKLR